MTDQAPEFIPFTGVTKSKSRSPPPPPPPRTGTTRKRVRNFTANDRAAHRVFEKSRREAFKTRLVELASLLPALVGVDTRRLSKHVVVDRSISRHRLQHRRCKSALVAARALLLERDELLAEVNHWRRSDAQSRRSSALRGLPGSSAVSFLPREPIVTEFTFADLLDEEREATTALASGLDEPDDVLFGDAVGQEDVVIVGGGDGGGGDSGNVDDDDDDDDVGASAAANDPSTTKDLEEPQHHQHLHQHLHQHQNHHHTVGSSTGVGVVHVDILGKGGQDDGNLLDAVGVYDHDHSLQRFQRHGLDRHGPSPPAPEALLPSQAHQHHPSHQSHQSHQSHPSHPSHPSQPEQPDHLTPPVSFHGLPPHLEPPHSLFESFNPRTIGGSGKINYMEQQQQQQQTRHDMHPIQQQQHNHQHNQQHNQQQQQSGHGPTTTTTTLSSGLRANDNMGIPHAQNLRPTGNNGLAMPADPSSQGVYLGQLAPHPSYLGNLPWS